MRKSGQSWADTGDFSRAHQISGHSLIILAGGAFILWTAIKEIYHLLSIDDLGNSAVYLCSEMSRGTTGEIHYVDGGYNIIGVPDVDD